MSFAALADEVLALKARAFAANDALRGPAAKLREHVLNRYAEEGSDRWRRGGGTVSVVKPSPVTQVTDRLELLAWLIRNEHDDLIVECIKVIDEKPLLDAIMLAEGSGEKGVRSPEAACALLLSAVKTWREPVADVWEQLVERDGFRKAIELEDGTARLVTTDGEVVPGIRRVTPPPTSIQVLPTKLAKRQAELDLLLEADEEGETDG